MTLLLDTHVLLWWLDDPEQISREALSEIRNQQNAVFVSAASVWEIEIKKALGKLDAPDNLDEAIGDCRFFPLSVTIKHALTLRELPQLHRDPFDRMLIAQTKVDGLTLVTRDSDIIQYPVSHLLA